MKFKVLLDRWKKDAAPLRTAKDYAVRLTLDDAARLQALAALYPCLLYTSLPAMSTTWTACAPGRR